MYKRLAWVSVPNPYKTFGLPIGLYELGVDVL